MSGGWRSKTIEVNRATATFLDDNILRWIGAHEFGHALGLDHIGQTPDAIDPNRCPGSVMWYGDEIVTVCNQTLPGPGDLKAVNTIYE